MNPNDHPHGGAKRKAPVGRKAPSTPWGKPALSGLKNRNNSEIRQLYRSSPQLNNHKQLAYTSFLAGSVALHSKAQAAGK